MKIRAYKLHFTTPLHISDQHEDYSISLRTIQSDTFYAALTAMLDRMGEKIPADGDLGFTISSLFPFFQKGGFNAESEKTIYFLPMPLRRQQFNVDPEYAKKAKKIKWIDSCLYGKILKGDDLINNKTIKYIQSEYFTENNLPINSNGQHDFMQSNLSVRCKIEDRSGKGNAIPYNIDRISFTYNSGLYFLTTGNHEKIEKALELLSIEGIGSDRSSGFGSFTYTYDDTFTIELPQEANNAVSLSLFIPENEEQLKNLLGDDVAYDFVRRGGWITTPGYTTIRKKSIYGFLPGSVFSVKNCNGHFTVGKIVDLKPETKSISPNHPVFRNGKSIMVPIIVK